MLEFLIIFGLFLFVIALMAIGVMFKRKPIAGSCGGLNSVGVEKVCQCETPCDKRRAAEEAQQVVG